MEKKPKERPDTEADIYNLVECSALTLNIIILVGAVIAEQIDETNNDLEYILPLLSLSAYVGIDYVRDFFDPTIRD
jgi:hypothetical protein